MKAVIMAGGEGSRLRPLTSLRPKPMVPVFNLPVMEHILGLVKHHGMTEVVATLAFMPQVIQDYFGSGEEWEVDVSYALEEMPLGTAGSVKNAEPLLGEEDFLVISGDALTDIDLTGVVRTHREKGGLVTIALKRVPDPLEYGVVITTEDGRIERFLEKPTWGQVFSDTINTGIYVVAREVLDLVPQGEPYDFSSDLFPRLLGSERGLFGCVVDGYWCDIGNLETYVQAHRDVLNGQAMVYVPGVAARDDVWVGEGTDIDAGAEIAGRVVLGKNVKVNPGARLGPYTVIGDNCVIGAEAVVEHSIVWDDAFVDGGATVRGAVVCRGVDVRRKATIETGVALGDEAVIGHDAFVGHDVMVYPFKRIEPAAVVNTSVIWESKGVRSLFGTDGISGLVGVDITPELALMVAQAYGTTLPVGSHVVVARDSSRAARMIKRAMVAGLNSAGVNARDLRVASPAVNRFTTRATRCVGGIHVCASQTDVQAVQIHFYGADGLDIPPSSQKKIERLYFRREFRRAFLDEVGEIIYPPRALEYYAGGLAEAMEVCPQDGRRSKVVADMGHGVASIVLPQVSAEWSAEIVTLNPFPDAERTAPHAAEPEEVALSRVGRLIAAFQADLGVRFDPAGEALTLLTPSGRTLDGDTALHLMVSLWCRTDGSGAPVVVPISASSAIERIAAPSGHRVVRSGRSTYALSHTAVAENAGFAGSRNGGYMFPSFLAAFDGVMSLGILIRMLSATDEGLEELADAVPPSYLREEQVFCPIDRKGAVMRAMTGEAGTGAGLTDGIRVELEEGWALVMPHPTEPLVDVVAEGADAESSARVLRTYVNKVKEAVSAE